MPRPGQAEIFSPLPSNGRSDFVEMFQFTATIDVSPYLCMAEAIKFRREVCGGEEKIMDYCHELARQGGKHAVTTLGTEVLPNDEGTCFANVRLPLRVGKGPDQIKDAEVSLVMAWMTNTLDKEYNTFIAIYPHAGSLWARLSGQIYLEMTDLIWGAGVLKTLCQRVSNGEHLEITPRL
jgi:hercynylcysteine S-oxide lyase